MSRIFLGTALPAIRATFGLTLLQAGTFPALQIKHPDLPLPQVQRVSEVAEFLEAMEVKLAEALESRPATGDGELLAVDPEGVVEV